MPKLSLDNQEASIETPFKMPANVPTVIVGVNRKCGIGNFENIDLYAGVSLPLNTVSTDDMEAFKAEVVAAISTCFEIAAEETYKRYDQIKKSIAPS